MSRAGWRGLPALAVAVAVVFPTLAGAATQVGQTFDAPFGCTADGTAVQSGSPGGQYAAPFAGVITSWSHEAGASPPQLKLKVARPLGGNDFMIVGDSPLESPVPGQLNTFANVRISVQAGDVIGRYAATSGGGCAGSGAGYVHHGFAGDPPPGTSATFTGPFGGNPLNFSATLEPDADNDGFGDETQDSCPADPSKQDCVPPDTTIVRGPKAKTKKTRATFEFTSAEAGATFECKLDDIIGFAPCGSPITLKVAKGRHNFEVRAVDAAKNADPTPASLDWKVKKKHRKKRK